jgi:hypothetical protein
LSALFSSKVSVVSVKLTFDLCFIKAGFLNDFYQYDPALATWTLLSSSVAGIAKRLLMGFTAAPSGKIYLFGGYGYGGYLAGP